MDPQDTVAAATLVCVCVCVSCLLMWMNAGSVIYTYKDLWGQNVTEVQEVSLGSGKWATPFALMKGGFLSCILRMMVKLLVSTLGLIPHTSEAGVRHWLHMGKQRIPWRCPKPCDLTQTLYVGGLCVCMSVHSRMRACTRVCAYGI